MQVAWGSRRPDRLSRPLVGQCVKAEVEAGAGLLEFPLATAAADSLRPGTDVTVDIFQAGQKVDITGNSIGKGFAGSIKRHGFSRGGDSHGNSLAHRAPGSIGQCQTPGRVIKGRRMPGHMGAKRRTVQNLELVRVDNARHLLLVKGAVPGARGGRVIVCDAVKTHHRRQPVAAAGEEKS